MDGLRMRGASSGPKKKQLPPHRLQFETNAPLLAHAAEERRKLVLKPFLLLKQDRKLHRGMRQSRIAISGRVLEQRRSGDRHDPDGSSLPFLGLPSS